MFPPRVFAAEDFREETYAEAHVAALTPRGCLWDKSVTSSRHAGEPPGGDVSLRCPSCGHPNRPDRRFYAACGGRLGQVCASCGPPAG